MAGSSPFPAKIYAETVLEVNFQDAQRYFLESLLEIQCAHVLMLNRQKIIPETTAQRCLEALDSACHHHRRIPPRPAMDGRIAGV
jgi:argininosuccinate lyase